MAAIAVIGTGYVGLTTGAYLAHLGHNVTCADVVAEKIAALQEGIVPIHEDGLDAMVAEGIQAGRLQFVLGAIPAVEHAEFVFLCLPTPQGEDGSADLSYVESVAREIGLHLRTDAVVVNKSTVPVGSNLRVAALLERDDVHVVSNPEFLREGQALYDSLHPDRIVIGAHDQEAGMRLAALYEALKAPVVVRTPRAPRRLSTCPTRFSPRRSASSTPSPTSANSSAPTCATWRKGWDSTSASASSSSVPVLVGAVPAFRRIRGRSSIWPRTAVTRSTCSAA